MALIIRLKRKGKTNSPFYRIVVADERRAAKGGKYVDELGYYIPVKDPANIKINAEKTLEWIKKGAKISDTVKSIIKKTDIDIYYAILKNKKNNNPEK